MTAIAKTPSPPGLLFSTVARKVLMAITGLVLTGFVLVHMAGNLLLYLGPQAINGYAEMLQSKPAIVWSARGILLASVILHAWAAAGLTRHNLKARPIGYRQSAYETSTYASRTMRWGGPLLLLFIVYHLLHFTVGSAHPDFIRGDVYHNVLVGFQNPVIAFLYVLAMGTLSLHLFHGIDSSLQTLGLSHPRYHGLRSMAGAGCAAVVTVGNLSFPLSVYFGLVR